MVFPHANFKRWIFNRAPIGTLGLATSSDWMTNEKFVDVMKHFVVKSYSTKQNSSLLIFDNCECYLSIQGIDIAKENGVILLTLQSHSSHKLKPLDKSVFPPFKTYYNEALNNLMMRNPDQPITIYQIAECVGYACEYLLTPQNITSGFT